MAPSQLVRCPRAARQRIQSSFSSLCRRHLGRRPQSGHPCAVDLVWRLSGGRLHTALAGCERIVRQAAAQGYRDLDIGVVVARWGAA
jgi:hypothetical protein